MFVLTVTFFPLEQPMQALLKAQNVDSCAATIEAFYRFDGRVQIRY